MLIAMDSPHLRRSQTERSAEMQGRLLQSAIDALIELGYAGTTVVEVCRRAEVTRGAFNHHYPSLYALLAQTLHRLNGLFAQDFAIDSDSLETLLGGALAATRRREFKALIELWLACRNDQALGEFLYPLIESASAMFDPRAKGHHSALSDAAIQTYHLCFEAIIGLALGQTVGRTGTRLAHRDAVESQILALARAADAAARRF